MLVVSALGYQRNDNPLFHSLSFKVPLREALMLTGPNGCGKTTLLRLIAGFILPDSGEITWKGNSARHDPNFIANLAYLGHLDGLKGPLTVVENIEFARHLADKPRPSKKQILSWLHAVGLTNPEFLTKPCQKLSAGQKRRVSLACVLAKEATLWLLDEPTSSLDAKAKQHFATCVEDKLKEGGCIIMSAHHDLPCHNTLELGGQK